MGAAPERLAGESGDGCDSRQPPPQALRELYPPPGRKGATRRERIWGEAGAGPGAPPRAARTAGGKTGAGPFYGRQGSSSTGSATTAVPYTSTSVTPEVTSLAS